MLKLVLDVGNTNLKAAFWNDKVMIKNFRNTSLPEISTQEILKKYGNPASIIVSSVLKEKININKYFGSVKNTIFLSHKTPVPIKIKYKTPETLGNDRLANAVGGWSLFPEYPVLIVDAGTCIKFDFVDSRGCYLGGSISPGLSMRFEALNHYTDRLPKVKFSGKYSLIGQSTRDAIISGVQSGITAEAEGMIEKYGKRYKALKVILTGGDFRFFAGKLKKHIFVAPNLTLIGLNEIIDFNAC